MPKVKRACIYSRVSGVNDTRDLSLETQEEKTAAALRQQGFVVEPDDIFREKGSGKDYANRPVLNRVRDLIAEGVYQGIGFYALDRLSRSMAHTALLFDEFEKHGVVPVSATEDVSDNSPEGKLIRSVRSYVAEVERLKIIDRVGRARTKLRDRNMMTMASKCRYGYRWDKKNRRRVVDDEESKVVLDIFTLCANGRSTVQIARRLNELGIATSSARHGYKVKAGSHAWRASVVANIIRDKTYLGWTINQRWKLVESEKRIDGHTPRKNGTVLKENPEGEWDVMDDTGELTPQIIPESLFEAANKAMADRRNNRGPTTQTYGKANHLLRGIIFCKVCGLKCYTWTTRRGEKLWLHYRCATYQSNRREYHSDSKPCGCRTIRAEVIDDAVWAKFCEINVTPGMLEDAIRRIADRGDERHIERDLAAARKQLEDKSTLRSKLYEKWRKEVASGEDPDFATSLEADYKSLKGPIDAFREMVRSLESQLVAIRDSPKAADGFRAPSSTSGTA